MKEIVDIFDSDGNRLDKKYTRGNGKHRFLKNEHIPIAIIFIENDKGQFLIQRTSKNKGNIYSSTGGHILSGESIEDGLIRETFEEIGIDVSNEKYEYVGKFITGVPIRFVYYLKKNYDLHDCNLDSKEVYSVQYMSAEEILKLINDRLFLESHGICFNRMLEWKKEHEK